VIDVCETDYIQIFVQCICETATIQLPNAVDDPYIEKKESDTSFRKAVSVAYKPLYLTPAERVSSCNTDLA
jgi:hypothetical protein